MSEQRVVIYTDGGCKPNPGPGAWGVLFILRGVARYIAGFEPHTTNNRMELCAAISALRELKTNAMVDLHTDSKYVKDGIQKWIHSWRRRGWLTYDNKPVVNQDLWQDLILELQSHDVNWKWVRGHADDRYNNFVDWLCTESILHRSNVDVRTTVGELERLIERVAQPRSKARARRSRMVPK